jgi:hypothetical protein
MTGCAPPAPTKAFVEQAARLHNQALVPTVATDTDLTEYFQIVGQRLMDGAHAAAPPGSVSLRGACSRLLISPMSMATGTRTDPNAISCHRTLRVFAAAAWCGAARRGARWSGG